MKLTLGNLFVFERRLFKSNASRQRSITLTLQRVSKLNDTFDVTT